MTTTSFSSVICIKDVAQMFALWKCEATVDSLPDILSVDLEQLNFSRIVERRKYQKWKLFDAPTDFRGFSMVSRSRNCLETT